MFVTFKGGYHFSGEPEKIFETFFGTDDPYSILNDWSLESLREMLGHELNNNKFIGSNKPKDKIVNVTCSLIELYNGMSKHVVYKRTVLNKDGRTTRRINEKKLIVIKPGYSENKDIIYKKQGNEVAGREACKVLIYVI